MSPGCTVILCPVCALELRKSFLKILLNLQGGTVLFKSLSRWLALASRVGKLLRGALWGAGVPGVTMGWSVGGGDWKWKEGSQREEVSTHQRGSDLKEEDK